MLRVKFPDATMNISYRNSEDDSFSEQRTPLLGEMSSNGDSGERPTAGAENTEDNDGKSKSETLWSKICSNVTLEPMLFLKMVAEGNFKVVGDTLEIDRVCRVNLNYSDTECQNMDNGSYPDIQNEVQKYQNTFNYHQTLMDSFIPLLVILFLGPLSDRYGRKPAMISVLIGFIGLSFIYSLTGAFEDWPVEVLYLATLLVDLGGTWVVFNMAVYSYIADITPVESRTKRMGFADAVWYLGSPVGTMLGGFIYKGFGFVAVYAVSGVLWVVSLLYCIFILKEPVRGDVDIDEWNLGRFGPLKYIFALFRSVFRKREGNGRLHVFVLIGLKLGVFLVQGHQVYLWARKVLQWDATGYSIWSGVEEGSHQAGMVGWVWLGERLHLHDCVIANGGVFSILLWSVTLACITGPSLWWLTIVASILGLLEASIEPAIRSMLTAVVGVGEEGKILSMLGILEAAWLSADRGLYTTLYNSCVDSFPQINYVVQAGIALLLMLVFVLLKKSLLGVRYHSH